MPRDSLAPMEIRSNGVSPPSRLQSSDSPRTVRLRPPGGATLMNREKFAWVTSVVLVALLAFQLPGSLNHRDDDYAFVNTLMTIHRQVADGYVEPVDEEKLRLGAINGMPSQTDPF